ncbi:MAG: hypothetical protein H0U70_04115 [Tatlockia sp.]|nr:hypothetical protein [Tatlockia sp.]
MKGAAYFFEILLLVIVPASLAFIELFHPTGFKDHVFHSLNDQQYQWLYIHYSQSFLFGLMAIAVYYLSRKENKTVLVWLIRLNLFLFLITYTVLDAVGGIAVGRLLTYVQTYGINESIINEIVQKLYNDPVIGGVDSIYSFVGSYAWLITIVLTVIFIGIKLRSHILQIFPALFLLLISGISLCISHAFPYGPIAFGAFALAGIWLLFLKNRAISAHQSFIF